MSAINRVGIKTSFAALDITAVAGAAPSRTLNIGHLPSVTRIMMNATAGSNFTLNIPGSVPLKNVSLDEIRMTFAVQFALAGQTVTIGLALGDSFYGIGGNTLVLTGAAVGDYQEVTIQSPPQVAFDAAVDTTVLPTQWTIESAASTASIAAPATLNTFGYVFNLGAQGPILVETPITFSAAGTTSGGITHAPGSSAIVVPAAGTYSITWDVTVTEASELALFNAVGGGASAFVPNTAFTAAALSQNIGQVVLVLPALSSLTLVNHTSTVGSINLAATSTGGTVANTNASFYIRRLA